MSVLDFSLHRRSYLLGQADGATKEAFATDGEVSKVYDFYIDDALWRLRYLVAETGNWMSRRRVLISLSAIAGIQGDEGEIHAGLSREQVQLSPDIDADKPVSRQQEMTMNSHYGWPAYWSPEALAVPEPILAMLNRRRKIEGDVHLRSFREMNSYEVHHGPTWLGRVEDFVIDDTDWSLAQMVVANGSWLDGKFRTIAAELITDISWSERRVSVDLAKVDLERKPAVRLRSARKPGRGHRVLRLLRAFGQASSGCREPLLKALPADSARSGARKAFISRQQ